MSRGVARAGVVRMLLLGSTRQLALSLQRGAAVPSRRLGLGPSSPSVGRRVVARGAGRLPAPASEEEEAAAAAGANETSWHKVGEARRAEHASRLAGVKQHDMEVVFLGTASCTPSVTRGVSCTALRYDGTTWLFDAGEGSQIQIQRSHKVHPGAVSAVFVTHTHGDHSFGLPGLLCIIGQDRPKTAAPLEIFGPQGLRLMIRTMLRLSHSKIAAPYRVHELVGVPLVAPRGFSAAVDRALPRNGGANGEFMPSSRLAREFVSFGEVEGGRDIAPDDDGCWTLIESTKRGEKHGDLSVRAAPMVHTVPCVGFVVREHDRPGTLRVDKVAPVVERNFQALKDRGVKDPRRVFRLIKEMKPGTKMTFPDGTVLKARDCVAEPKPGRVVAICGDTADASALLPLIPPRGADLVIHEATNAHIPRYDTKETPAQLEKTTVSHGHSTPAIAGRFAKRAKASRLALTHFSARYKGDAAPLSLDVMLDIENQARLAFKGPPSHDAEAPDLDYQDSVVAAWDFLTIPMPLRTSEEEDDDGRDEDQLEAGEREEAEEKRAAPEA